MRTLNSLRKSANADYERSTYRIQLHLPPALAEEARKCKFLLEQHKGMTMSWSVCFMEFVAIVKDELKKRPRPIVDILD